MSQDDNDLVINNSIYGPFERRSFDLNSFVRSPMQRDEEELNKVAQFWASRSQDVEQYTFG